MACFMHTGDDIRNYLDVNVLLKMRSTLYWRQRTERQSNINASRLLSMTMLKHHLRTVNMYNVALQWRLSPFEHSTKTGFFANVANTS